MRRPRPSMVSEPPPCVCSTIHGVGASQVELAHAARLLLREDQAAVGRADDAVRVVETRPRALPRGASGDDTLDTRYRRRPFAGQERLLCGQRRHQEHQHRRATERAESRARRSSRITPPPTLYAFRYTAFCSTKNSSPVRPFSGRPMPELFHPPNGRPGSLKPCGCSRARGRPGSRSHNASRRPRRACRSRTTTRTRSRWQVERLVEVANRVAASTGPNTSVRKSGMDGRDVRRAQWGGRSSRYRRRDHRSDACAPSPTRLLDGRPARCATAPLRHRPHVGALVERVAHNHGLATCGEAVEEAVVDAGLQQQPARGRAPLAGAREAGGHGGAPPRLRGPRHRAR